MVRVVVSVNADGLPGKSEMIFQSCYVYLHLCVARRGMAWHGMVPCLTADRTRHRGWDPGLWVDRRGVMGMLSPIVRQ